MTRKHIQRDKFGGISGEIYSVEFDSCTIL